MKSWQNLWTICGYLWNDKICEQQWTYRKLEGNIRKSKNVYEHLWTSMKIKSKLYKPIWKSANTYCNLRESDQYRAAGRQPWVPSTWICNGVIRNGVYVYNGYGLPSSRESNVWAPITYICNGVISNGVYVHNGYGWWKRCQRKSTKYPQRITEWKAKRKFNGTWKSQD